MHQLGPNGEHHGWVDALAALADPSPTGASADALCWTLTRTKRGARLRTNADVAVDAGWLHVEARLPHEVRFRVGAITWIESVSADIDSGGDALPAMSRRVLPGVEYTFRSSIERLPARPFALRVGAIVTHYGDDPHALAVHDADALTVVAIERTDGEAVRWRAWHGFPRTGDLVATVADARPR